MTAARSDLTALAREAVAQYRGMGDKVIYSGEHAANILEHWLDRLAASRPDRSDASPGPDVSLSAPVGEPVAYVPIHPRNGPLWMDTFPANADVSESRSASYDRRALYTHPPAPVREALDDLRRDTKKLARELQQGLPKRNAAEQLEAMSAAASAALTRPLGGFVQGSIATKQSTDPESSSRTETAGGAG